ncbi:ion channel [Tenacibaculum pacificus]|uniref:ion channel n=1 Tax=Tenacibaculum pacificus TaxID=3018314 RepID=UPI0022F3B2AF|nr:ion channel [Tenacibaculum pacificus]WBX73670.1 ion channel [Tenacibaculum pacificus]
MLDKLYNHRFEFFFFSQLAILFGSLIVPQVFFDEILSPILFLINLSAGILLISKRKILMWFSVLLLIISAILFGSDLLSNSNQVLSNYIKLISYFLFYIVVTYEIIKQVWRAVEINKNVILGLISGYISLGLIGFFICISIEISTPGSFHFVQTNIVDKAEFLFENLMYFSYITLLTIGYGDIYPVSKLAHKTAILIGLMGQIYLVVITAIVVGKYINQLSEKNIKE